jgi:Rieske 2Fe-2S family protein
MSGLSQSLEKSLPSAYYTASAIFQREKNLIFSREWFCGGREEQLPQPGSFTVLDVLGESILVVRTKNNELKAHYNVCRHRGARLCSTQDERWDVHLTGGVTSAATIRCPYHQWTYSLDGALLSAPFLRDAEGFCKEDFSLYSVGVETWGGFFFLNLSPENALAEERDLASQLGAVPTRVRNYPLHELKTAKQVTYDVEANWKLIAENYNECYHCGPVHPELCEIVPDFKRAGGASLDWDNGVPHREGAFTFTHSGTTIREPFANLSDDERIRHKGELIYPNLLLSLSCDHATAFLLWPIAPDRTRVECSFLFHPDEMSRPSFNPSDAVEFWDLVNRQDWAICERVQQGVESQVHHFGFYAPMEDPSLDIRRYVLRLLGPVQP